MSREVVLETPDATVRRYVREADRLILEIELWDESLTRLEATEVSVLLDTGAWESDAVVRVPELDAGQRLGYGIVSVDGELTLQFAAKGLS